MIFNAPCAGEWQLFDSTEPEDHLLAKSICETCPFLAECRELRGSLRLTGGIMPEGTWAGIGHQVDRRWKCGTRNGYDGHRYHREEPCEPCNEARRLHNLARTEERRRVREQKNVDYADRKIGNSSAA